jgi:hypothetical protein
MTLFSITENLKKRFANWRTALVFASFLAMFIASCQKDNILGIELQPKGQFDTLTFIDTLSVKAYTLLGHRQRSDEAQSYLGEISSPVFGQAQSAIALNFQLIAGNLNLFEGYIVDSVVLHLRPDRIYGAPTDPVAIEVYEIAKPLYLDSGYYSDYDAAVKGEILGTANLSYPRQIKVTDTIDVDGNAEAFQFRIRLDNSLGDYLRDGLLNSTVTSTKTFQQYFNGLYIKPRDNQSLSTGAFYSLALTYGESGIRVYVTNTSTQTREVIKFPINGECARVNQFKHDYTGSLAENYLSPSSTQNDLIFVQGMAGLRSEIQIPGLYNLGKSTNAAIAKATISFEFAESQPADLGRAKQLYLLDLEKDGIETLTLDYIYSKERSGGRYNKTTGRYVFDITRHVQKVMDNAKNGLDVNYGLRLHAQVPALNGNDTSNNVLLGMDNIEFKLYQTDLNN